MANNKAMTDGIKNRVLSQLFKRHRLKVWFGHFCNSTVTALSSIARV